MSPLILVLLLLCSNLNLIFSQGPLSSEEVSSSPPVSSSTVSYHIAPSELNIVTTKPQIGQGSAVLVNLESVDLDFTLSLVKNNDNLSLNFTNSSGTITALNSGDDSTGFFDLTFELDPYNTPSLLQSYSVTILVQIKASTTADYANDDDSEITISAYITGPADATNTASALLVLPTSIPAASSYIASFFSYDEANLGIE